MLDPTSRVAIIVVSGLCVAASLRLSPAHARGLGIDDETASRQVMASPVLDRSDAVPIVRDPFNRPAFAPVPSPAAPDTSARPAAAGRAVEPLPSNLSSDSIPAIPGTEAPAAPGSLRLTAIVTGAHPYALVEIGGVHEIKGIGDRIAGTTITSIDLSGIVLQNGERFTVDAGAHS